MSFFDKLFGRKTSSSDAKRATERIIEDVNKEAEPFHRLLSNLIHAFCQSAEEVKRYFTPERLKESSAHFILRQEFMYFFIHITKRLAFSSGYAPQQMNDLGSVLLVTLESSLQELPEHLREQVREIAIHEADLAEADYATAKGLFPENDPGAFGDSLYAKLARRIEDKLGRQHNPEIALQIIMTTSEKLIQAAIPPLLQEIRPLISGYVETLNSLRRRV